MMLPWRWLKGLSCALGCLKILESCSSFGIIAAFWWSLETLGTMGQAILANGRVPTCWVDAFATACSPARSAVVGCGCGEACHLPTNATS